MTPRDPRSDPDLPAGSAIGGVITLASPVSVDQLLRRVVARIDSLKLEIFAVVDHSGEAGAVGLAMPDTKLVLFGNPSVGTPLMLGHPLLALDLPLRLLLWTADDNRAFLSLHEPSFLPDRFDLTATESAPLRIVDDLARAVTNGDADE